MQRIIIICEGETEQEFCKKTLFPHFFAQHILLTAPLIKKSKGGIVKWSTLKKEIQTHLQSDKSVFVTTLLDYYGIKPIHEFPDWDVALKIVDKNKRMNALESAMKADLPDTLRYRFFPYLQLHEFEGLLFNNLEVFHQHITKNDLIGLQELEQTFQAYDNPEMINDNKTTAPSYRLQRIIKGYNKIVHGNILAEAIGLYRIIEKSPRFRQWVHQIETVK
jgi:Domain of unknown function (DUF4276)